MSIFKWLRRPQAARAMLLYKRGLAKGKKRDHQGAMDDYTAVIDTPDAPADVRAMALYNRALLYAGKKDLHRARADLEAVLAMKVALPDIKSAAHRTLDRVRRQQGVAAAPPSVAPFARQRCLSR